MDTVVRERLQPYLPIVRRWWAELPDLVPPDTGIYTIEYDEDQPPGIFYRFTRTAIRSPIKGIQAFPFVVAGYLQITGVRGGSTKLIQRMMMQRDFILDEFTCLELHNLPSTFNQGQLIAFVPTELFLDTAHLGKWIYLTTEEISDLIRGVISESVMVKAIRHG